MNPLSDSSDSFLPTPFFHSKPPLPAPPSLPKSPSLQSLLSYVSLGKNFKKEDFSLEKHGILLIDSLMSLSMQATNSDKNPENIRILSQTQFLEAILGFFYPISVVDTMKNIDFTAIEIENSLKTHFFTRMEEALESQVNLWILSRSLVFEGMVKVEKIEKNSQINEKIQKIIRKVLEFFPNGRNLGWIFDGLVEKPRENTLKMLREVAISAYCRQENNQKSLFFKENAGIWLETISGLKNPDSFSVYFEARLSALKSHTVISMANKAKTSHFQIRFNKPLGNNNNNNNNALQLVIGINQQETLSFSLIFRENTWFSLLLHIEKSGVYATSDSNQQEALKYSPIKALFKQFEKPFSLSIGSEITSKNIENQGFFGEIRAFFLIDKPIKSLEDIMLLKESEAFLSINSLAFLASLSPLYPEEHPLSAINSKPFRRPNLRNQCPSKNLKELYENKPHLGYYQQIERKSPENREKNPNKSGFLSRLLKPNPQKRTGKKHVFSTIRGVGGVFLLESGSFSAAMLSTRGLEKLIFLINFYNEFSKEKTEARQGVLLVFELIKVLVKYEEIQDFFIRNGTEILVFELRNFSRKQGISREILDAYMDLYVSFAESLGFQVFSSFLLDFRVIWAQEFNVQTGFLQKMKLELEKNPKLLEFIREKREFLIKIMLSLERYQQQEGLKLLEFETYRDFFLDVLFVILKDARPRLIETLTPMIRMSMGFSREYLELLRRVYQSKGNHPLPLEKSLLETKNVNKSPEIAIFLDKSQGNLLILEKFSQKNTEIKRKDELMRKGLDFEDFLLELATNKPDIAIETIDFFLEVFLENRRTLVLEGSLDRLVQLQERDLDKIRFLKNMPLLGVMNPLLFLLKQSQSLGLGLEEALLGLILHGIPIEASDFGIQIEELMRILDRDTDLKVFFLGSEKKAGLLVKLLNNFNAGDTRKDAFFKEVVELGMNGLEGIGGALEVVLGYDGGRYLPLFRDALGELLEEKCAGAGFLRNLTEILRIFIRVLRTCPAMFNITSKTYILAWKLFAALEAFGDAEGMVRYYKVFLDLVFEVVLQAEKPEDLVQGLQILRKMVLGFGEVLARNKDLKRKLGVYHSFLVFHPPNIKFFTENPPVLRFLYSNLREIFCEVWTKEDFLEVCLEAIEKDWVVIEQSTDFEQLWEALKQNERLLTEDNNLKKVLECLAGKAVECKNNLTIDLDKSKLSESEKKRKRKERKNNFKISLEKASHARHTKFLKDIKAFNERETQKDYQTLRKHERIFKTLRKELNFPISAENPLFKIEKVTDSLSRKLFITPLRASRKQTEYLSAQKYQENLMKTSESLSKKTDFPQDLPESFSQKSNLLINFSAEKPDVLSEISRKHEPSMDSKNLLLRKTSGVSCSSFNDKLLEPERELSCVKFQSQQLIICESPQKKTLSCDKSLNEMVKFRKNIIDGSIKESNDKDSPIKSSNKASNIVIERSEVKENNDSDIPKSIYLSNSLKETTDTVSFQAEKIAIKGSIWGLLTINPQGLAFQSSLEQRPNVRPFIFGSLEESFLRTQYQKLWGFGKIAEVQTRSFNSQRNSFEIFLYKGKSYFFIVHTPQTLQQVFAAIKQFNKTNKNLILTNDLEKSFKKDKWQEKWLKNEISNFEYLTKVNQYSGRSLNDINQYPVFPWTYVDFLNPSLDLSNPKNYRDLSKPIGALDENRLAYLKERMKGLNDERVPEDQRMKPFLYGSHYAGAGHIMHFLIRLEPITSLCLSLQSGKFDCADRLFIDIAETWRSCLYFQSDFKELIPEFYYNGEFLKNRNRYEFGKTQLGAEVSGVVLPKWARNPEEFVFRQRQALEGKVVSRMLNMWIDLIFGVKQNGEEALKADNLFYYMTYEGAVDLNAIEDENELKAVLTQLASYGQTPHQLFKAKHPEKRHLKDENIVFLQRDATTVDFDLVFTFPQEILSCQVTDDGIRIFLEDFSLYFLPIIHQIALVPYAAWDPQELKKKPAIIDFNQDFEESPVVYFFRNANLSNLMIISGSEDCGFHFFKDSKRITHNLDPFHRKPLSSLTAFEKGGVLFCGSKDCRISIWEFNFETLALKSSPFSKGKNVFLGHEGEIINMEYEEQTDLLISVDREGICLLFSLRLRRLMRRIQAGNEKIIMGMVHPYGVIAAFSRESSFLFNLNGDVVERKSMESGRILRQAAWLGKNSSEIALAFDNGDLEVYEIFGWECKRLFILPLLGEKKKIKFFRIFEALGEVFLVLKDGQLVAMRKSEFSRQAQKNETVDVCLSEMGIE